MRATRWAMAGMLGLVLGACARPSPGDVATPTPGTAAADAVQTVDAARAKGPALTVAVLVDPGADSPFRWDPVTPRTRVESGAMWAPAADVVAVLRPGATFAHVDDHLEVDARPIAVPVQVVDTAPWAPVAPLAFALGGFARRHPDDGSVVVWPQLTLRWLAAHGDPNAPVLREARAAGWSGAPTPTGAAAGIAHLRVRNEGPADAIALRVLFPHEEIAFGDVPAGAMSAYQPAPGGVYGYGAYRLRVDAREVTVPVIDWVGESPLQGSAFTYVVAVDPHADPPVRLVRVDREP
jgi:hypothetical protein